MSAPLLLVPGLVCDARLFAPQIAAVSARRAVQIAAPPQGDSLAAMAKAVLDAAPDRFALAGHGLGGMVALEIVRKAAERVTRLALIASDFLPDSPAAAAARDVQVARARGGQFKRVLSDDLAPAWLGPVRPPAVLRSVVEMGIAQGPDVFIRQAEVLRRRRDLGTILDSVRVPALVLGGAEDRVCPASRQKVMAARLPQATLEIVADAAHLPTLTAPEAVNRALLRWLTDALVLT